MPTHREKSRPKNPLETAFVVTFDQSKTPDRLFLRCVPSPFRESKNGAGTNHSRSKMDLRQSPDAQTVRKKILHYRTVVAERFGGKIVELGRPT